MDNQATKVIKKNLRWRAVWLTFGRTTQLLCQCRRACHSDFLGAFHQRPCHNQQQVSTAIVEPTNTPSQQHIEHDAPVAHQPKYFRVRGCPQPLWLELLPTGPTRLQGSSVQIPQNMRFVGKQKHWCMVHQSISGPLPMQPFFHPKNTRIPDIRLLWIVPQALPGAVPNVERAPPRGDWWAHHNIERATYSKKMQCTWQYQKHIRHWRPTTDKKNTHKPYPRMALTSGQTTKGAHHHPPWTKGSKGWHPISILMQHLCRVSLKHHPLWRHLLRLQNAPLNWQTKHTRDE